MSPIVSRSSLRMHCLESINATQQRWPATTLRDLEPRRRRSAAVVTTVLSGLIIICCSGGMAAAGTMVLPAKAKKMAFAMVNGLPQCTAPDTQTITPVLFQACSYPGPQDGLCQLTDAGSGRLVMSQTGSQKNQNQDIKVKVQLKGMNASCEGKTLVPVLSFRLSTAVCAESPTCIIPDLVNVKLSDGSVGGCLVNGGKCTFGLTLNTAAPEVFIRDSMSAIQILGCGMTSSDDSSHASPPIACGTFLR